MIIMSSLDNSGKRINFSPVVFYQSYESSASPVIASFFKRHRDEIVKILIEGRIREDFLEENIRHVESIFFCEAVGITEKEALAIHEHTPLPRIKSDILRYLQHVFPDNLMGQESAIRNMLAEGRDDDHIKILVYFLNSDKLDDERKKFLFQTLQSHLRDEQAKATGEVSDLFTTAHAVFWLTRSPRSFVKGQYDTIKTHVDWFEKKLLELNAKGKVNASYHDLYSNWLNNAKQEMSSWREAN
jgi:hypothetical protein